MGAGEAEVNQRKPITVPELKMVAENFQRQSQNVLKTFIGKNLEFDFMLHLGFNKLSKVTISSFISLLEILDIFKKDGVRSV